MVLGTVAQAQSGAFRLPGRHLPTVDGATRLEMSVSGEVLYVGGATLGQLIRGWQGPGFGVTLIPVRGGSGGATFSLEGGTLYRAGGEAGVISRYATEGGDWQGDIRVQGFGGGAMRRPGLLGELALGVDGRVLFAGDPLNRRVVAVEVETGRILGEMDMGRQGAALVGSGGRLFGLEWGVGRGGEGGGFWVADVRVPERPVVMRRWKAREVWGRFLGDAQAGAGQTGDHLVADATALIAVQARANALVRIDLGTGRMAAWRVLKGRDAQGGVVTTSPRGIALDSAGGRLFVAESGLDAIGVLDAGTLTPRGHISTPAHPYRLAVAPGGGMLACLCLGGLGGLDGGPGGGMDPGGGARSARPVVTVLTVPSAAELEAGSQRVLSRAGVMAMESSGATLVRPGDGGPGEEEPPSGEEIGASARPLPSVRMPVEVLGVAGAKEEVRLTLTGMEALRGTTLCLTVHGVQYEDKARVTINGSHSVSINHRTARVLGNARKFGGLGGGFHTIPLEIDLPRGVLREGENLLVFEYTRQDSYAVSGFQRMENRVDDASSGYRVIRLNLGDRAGNRMLGVERFEEDDPRHWGPPETEVALDQAILDGWNLWRGLRPDGTAFRLKNYSEIGLTPVEIQATCGDCHAQDGRDLKYYNYSNRSIVARSEIHGLTQEEGRRIAAYIRTLPGAPVVPQARPWNPPFQPGPGMDSRPAYEWAAGAGVEAVLEDPVETLNGIFPGAYRKTAGGGVAWDLSKITPDPIRSKASLSIREVPISMQLLDWNHWLPKVHPMDGYADMAETNAMLRAQISGLQKLYTNTVRALRLPTGPTNYAAVVSFSQAGQAAMAVARSSYPFDRMNHTLKEAQRRYALMLVPLVKSWELYMEYGYGDRIACATCGPGADERSWRVGMTPFSASPNIAGLLDTRESGVEYAPRHGHGIGNNQPVTFNYVSSAWYHLQLLLDHGNRNPLCGVNVAAPFDWPYVLAHLKDLQGETAAGAGLSMMPLMYLYLAKAPQIYDTGLGVDRSQSGGWQPFMVMPYYLQLFTYGTDRYQDLIWKNIPPEARGRLMEVLYRVWLDMNLESSREKYFVPVFPHDPDSYLGFVPPDTQIGRGPNTSLADRVHFVLQWRVGSFDGTLGGFGVSEGLQNELIDWAKSIWPLNGDGTEARWDQLRPSAEPSGGIRER